jgi:hypothetical protein
MEFRLRSDLDREPGKSHFILAVKQQVNDYLKEKADEGKITWSAIANGPFFGWGTYRCRRLSLS